MRRGSGGNSPSHSNNTPFVEAIVAHPGGDVNTDFADEKNTPPNVGSADVVFAENEETLRSARAFGEELDSWMENQPDKRRTDGGYFTLGKVSSILHHLGIQSGNVLFRKSKIQYTLDKHPEISDSEIKQVPFILNDPVLVMKSSSRDDSIVVIGDQITKDNRRQLVSLLLNPTQGGCTVTDFALVTSTYGKSNSSLSYNILGDSDNKPSEILFLSEDKERVEALVRPLRVQFPSGNLKLGSVGSITYDGSKVNIIGKNIYELLGQSDPNEALCSTRSTGLDSRTILEGYEPQNDLESCMVGKYLTTKKGGVRLVSHQHFRSELCL